jgi:predicted RNase H-like HicB family nuclease
MTVMARGYVVVTMRATKDEETGQYVAVCEDLDVASCGDSIEDAFAQIEDAVELFLNALEEEGERERVFAERGIVIHEGDLPSHEATVTTSVHPDELVKAGAFQVPLAA